MKRTLLTAVLLCVGSANVLAQVPQTQSSRPTSESASAAEDFRAAQAALDRGNLKQALLLVERAHLQDPQPYYLYYRVLVFEAMGELEHALRIIEENRAAMNQDPRVKDLVTVEQRIRTAARQTASEEQATEDASRTGRAVLGPVLVGTGGLVLVGLSIYGLAARCESRSSVTGECLRERSPGPMTAVYGGLGLGALAGAILWFAFSGDSSVEANQTSQPRFFFDGRQAGVQWRF